jgi:hypothetical protein
MGGQTRGVQMRVRALLVACFVVASSLIATPALADDGDEPLGPFSPWSTPENLGPPVNSKYEESAPAQPDVNTIYFNHNFNNTKSQLPRQDRRGPLRHHVR